MNIIPGLFMALALTALLLAVTGILKQASPTPNYTYEIFYPDSSTKCIIASHRSNNKISISCDFYYTGEQQ